MSRRVVVRPEAQNTLPSCAATSRWRRHRTSRRDDVRPGLRITNDKKRAVTPSPRTPSRFLSLAFSTATRTTKRSCKTIRTTAAQSTERYRPSNFSTSGSFSLPAGVAAFRQGNRARKTPCRPGAVARQARPKSALRRTVAYPHGSRDLFFIVYFHNIRP